MVAMRPRRQRPRACATRSTEPPLRAALRAPQCRQKLSPASQRRPQRRHRSPSMRPWAARRRVELGTTLHCALGDGCGVGALRFELHCWVSPTLDLEP